jgi:hypothetical protein
MLFVTGRVSAGRASKKVPICCSMSAAHRPIAIRIHYVGCPFQDNSTMSPMSFMLTGRRRVRKYISVLLALHSGVRCRCARSGVWQRFIARYSARRSTADGASSTRRGSWIAGWTRVNAFRFTGNYASPCSRVSYARHPSVVSCHPLFPCCRLTLLTYIQRDLFTVDVVWAGLVVIPVAGV